MSSVPSKASYASFPSEKLTISAGIAIFHLAAERVVVCYHTRDHYWFLPKGRKNANEDLGRAAEREGFEESGYRNRLLPIPMKHRQPDPEAGHQEFVTEAIWLQLMPLSTSTQYILHWYAAETLPPAVEKELDAKLEDGEGNTAVRAYEPPEPFPKGLTIQQRIDMDIAEGDGVKTVYMPVWHPGTGVDEEEMCYKSYMLSIEDAIRKLKGTIMADVVHRAWDGIQLRKRMESKDGS
ncbi:hypothetical protein K431DRAFT_224651 [Polychaeton citri CBS 116435]|uniref:Nudix hydrolase domain-containing protein n=1 Tax=Polychaeton citri CBS 116435 TaxID=1314669 RepID=A0A9P4Q7V8_9PEZI|nr:hypothetical protein K431DRAFT_224651 [Polychaeton citri CBS 116435]